mmetsp:Transcript_60478/g.136701  ORF Transcript_60478/g.136701 Transcript_60478/m.136701 type:complete len:276 (-) Transcript_60478:473-1300(-)
MRNITSAFALLLVSGESFLGFAPRYDRKSILMAKKKTGANTATSGGRGFSTKAGTQEKPRTLAPPSTSNEVFKISEYPLPTGEGISTLFMGAFVIEDPSVCDDLVKLFESNPQVHKKGVIGRDGRAVVDETKKDSLEISFLPEDSRPEWRRYLSALQQVMPRYVEKYPYSANYVGEWGLSSPTNFQHYPPGGGYKVYHTERRDRKEPGASRHLVFMTYMNDVTDQGGTQFFHQNVTVQPVKGLTIVWPADWTFMHRGIASPSQTKQIMTGWFNYA